MSKLGHCIITWRRPKERFLEEGWHVRKSCRTASMPLPCWSLSKASKVCVSKVKLKVHTENYCVLFSPDLVQPEASLRPGANGCIADPAHSCCQLQLCSVQPATTSLWNLKVLLLYPSVQTSKALATLPAVIAATAWVAAWAAVAVASADCIIRMAKTSPGVVPESCPRSVQKCYMAPTATKENPKIQTRPYEPSPEQLFCHRITGLRYHKNSVLNPQSLARNVVSHAHASCMTWDLYFTGFSVWSSFN